MSLKKEKQFLIFFLIILGLGLFLRFYQFPERISMDSDSGRDAFVAWYGAKNLQLPLTGPFTSIAQVVMGPWYWWQLIFASLIIPSKFAPWIYFAIMSSLLMIVAYKIGYHLKNRTFGMLMMLVAALSPIQITYAHWLTNHGLVGFFSSLTVLFFIKIVKEKQKKLDLIFFGLSLGATVNEHFQSTGLMTLLFLLLFLKPNRFRNFFLAGLFFSLTFLPLLFFELTNHWFNTRHLLDYLFVGQYRIWTSTRWLTYVFNFWPNFWSTIIGGNYYSSLFFMFASAFIMLWRFFKKTLSKELVLLGISFIVQVIIIRYFRGEKYFNYLNFFHPFILIFTASVLYLFFSVKQKIILGSLVMVVYLFLVIPGIRDNLYQTFEVEIKNNTHKKISQILNYTNKNKYTLYRCPTYDHIYGKALLGYSYLQNNIDEKSNYKIGYLNGECFFPETFESSILKLEGVKINYEEYFPKIGDELYDLSAATEGARLKAGWIPLTIDYEYQDAARWWFKEQP